MDEKDSRIAALFEEGKYDEICNLCPEDAPREDPRAVFYGLAAHFLSKLPTTREGLTETWQRIRPLMQQALSGAPLSHMAAAQEVVIRCATAHYRACNDRLKLEYAVLQGDVCFEKKEYVIDRMRELLLGADIDFDTILEVLNEAGALAVQTEGLDHAPEEFFLGTLRLLQNAAQISEDNGLVSRYPHILIARRACLLPLRPEMTDALDKRRELLELTLHGDEALADWSFFAPYAEQAGISREVLVKAQKKRRRIERLKFWKKRPEQSAQ